MRKFKIGIQLFSLRDEMSKDLKGTLKAVADMGYECVEFAGYHGHSAEEVRTICDKLGLDIVSVHQTHKVFIENPEENVKFLKTLGVRYSVIPYVNPDEWKTDYDRLISEIKNVGKLLKDNGIQLLYHNHDFELTLKHGDKFVLDAMYSEVPSDILCPELDMCWVKYSGQDPVEYLKKYGQIKEVLHVKDFVCKNNNGGAVYDLIDDKGNVGGDGRKDRDADGFEFRPVGYGIQDFEAILKAAEETNVKYLIVEQDQHYDKTALEDAKLSIDYLHSIGY